MHRQKRLKQHCIVKDRGLDLVAIDVSVRPQDDFYNYVNGNWMKTAQIPSDKPVWEALINLQKIQITIL